MNHESGIEFGELQGQHGRAATSAGREGDGKKAEKGEDEAGDFSAQVGSSDKGVKFICCHRGLNFVRLQSVSEYPCRCIRDLFLVL